MPSDPKPPPSHPIQPEAFLQMVPSSAAKPAAQPLPMKQWRLSVQYRGRNNRWNELTYWFVTTNEPNMDTLLNFGLKEQHRVVVAEHIDVTPPSNADER